MQPEWFETWFDSPYYPLLYTHRNATEADHFIHKLKSILQLPAGAQVFDLGCGQGRHSRVLGELGYNVTGADISRSSIEKAKTFETANLNFVVHDMRRPVAVNYFDAVLNLFTSFGYFENLRDNQRTISAVHVCLKDNGLLLIDYFNSEKVREYVIDNPAGVCDSGGIHFSWIKNIIDNRVVKQINVNDDGREHHFTESVSLFTLKDFSEMLDDKFEIMQTFGDYELGEFDFTSSPRLILLCRKK